MESCGESYDWFGRFYRNRVHLSGLDGALVTEEYPDRIGLITLRETAHDQVSRNFVESYVNRISAAIRRALEHAKMQGDLRDDVNTEQESRLLAATLLGFFVFLRAQIDPKILQSASIAAVEHIKSLQH